MSRTRVLNLNVWAGDDLFLETAEVSDRSQIVCVTFRRGSGPFDVGESRLDLGKMWFIDQPFEGVDVNREEVRRAAWEATQAAMRPVFDSVPLDEHVELLERALYWMTLVDNRSLLQYGSERTRLREDRLELEARLDVLRQMRGRP